MQTERTKRNVLTVKFDDVRAGWEQWFMLRSDVHFDSRHCQKSLLKQHMDLAKERNAMVIDCGDLFDAMQGRYDPRRSYPDMRTKYLEKMQNEDKGYLQVVQEDVLDFHKPYLENMLMIGKGNHETSIERHNDTNLTQGICALMNLAGANVYSGFYGGYVRFQFVIQKTRRETKLLKYFHGAGGSASPVTRGVIQTNRQAVIYPDADIVINGHNHEGYIVYVPRERMTNDGNIIHDNQIHVRTPGYKDGWADGAEGFDVEKGAPKANGCVWLRFYFKNEEVRTDAVADFK